MINLNYDGIKIVSSLPGRLRANISNLFRNDKIAFNIKIILIRSRGVFSVKPSKVTGNVLINYDTAHISENEIMIILDKCLNIKDKLEIAGDVNNDSLYKIIFHTLNPLSLFGKKRAKEIYTNEYIGSKKIINISFIMSGITFLVTNSIYKAFSVLILGYPGILFSIALVSCYYASSKLKCNGIYFKDYHSFYLIKDVNILLIDSSLFLNKFITLFISLKESILMDQNSGKFVQFTIPELWVRSSCIVIILPFGKSGMYLDITSSIFIRPFSTSCIIAMAVNCLVMEPMGNIVSSVFLIFCSKSDFPYPLLRIILPFCATSTLP